MGPSGAGLMHSLSPTYSPLSNSPPAQRLGSVPSMSRFAGEQAGGRSPSMDINVNLALEQAIAAAVANVSSAAAPIDPTWMNGQVSTHTVARAEQRGQTLPHRPSRLLLCSR